MQTNNYYWIDILETIKLFVLNRNTWNYIIVYELLVLDRNIWNPSTVSRLFVLNRNTW